MVSGNSVGTGAHELIAFVQLRCSFLTAQLKRNPLGRTPPGLYGMTSYPEMTLMYRLTIILAVVFALAPSAHEM